MGWSWANKSKPKTNTTDISKQFYEQERRKAFAKEMQKRVREQGRRAGREQAKKRFSGGYHNAGIKGIFGDIGQGVKSRESGLRRVASYDFIGYEQYRRKDKD